MTNLGPVMIKVTFRRGEYEGKATVMTRDPLRVSFKYKRRIRVMWISVTEVIDWMSVEPVTQKN